MTGAILTNFLVPFIIGFLLLIGTSKKYKYQHLNNEILFLHSLLWGFGFTFFIYIVWPCYDATFLISEASYWQTLKQFIAVEFQASGKKPEVYLLPDYLVAALSLSVVISVLDSIALKIFPWLEDIYLIRATYSLGNRLDRLLYKAKQTRTPLMVTLKNRKVYIGIVLGFQEYSPRNEKRYLSLLPIESGYRESVTLAYEKVEDYRFFTQFLMNFYDTYQKWIPSKKANSFEIEKGRRKAKISLPTVGLIAEYPLLVDMDEILTATPWVQEIYNMFKDGKKKPPPVDKKKKP